MRSELDNLATKIINEVGEMRKICHHPKDHILYSATSYRHEDDYGKATGTVLVFETWECELCGKTEHVEQTLDSNKTYTMYRYDEKEI